MNIGLEQHTVDAITDVFRKYPQITCAILYGSRAKGNYRPNSDIDITLKGEELDLSTLYKIETTLDDLLLPYRIDLSNFQNIENSDLKDHINRVGIAFYTK
ncbi:nucleotidyltransferase domain-containing protein [Lunatibacter salilacus]|uniref:nucleotidyltransferase domain-containing protein n=1 Tax=Lunatibacter salilacus TaxID=2483804 RepID=UPI00131C2F36|nr:nucleotidyltransferase domain-containing protein [Lunatibacter salilacus]